jgi:hypothetical protein
MVNDIKESIRAPKKAKVVCCDKTCVYVSAAKEPTRCNNKCKRLPGHILDCKCRVHEMQ